MSPGQCGIIIRNQSGMDNRRYIIYSELPGVHLNGPRKQPPLPVVWHRTRPLKSSKGMQEAFEYTTDFHSFLGFIDGDDLATGRTDISLVKACAIRTGSYLGDGDEVIVSMSDGALNIDKHTRHQAIESTFKMHIRGFEQDMDGGQYVVGLARAKASQTIGPVAVLSPVHKGEYTFTPKQAVFIRPSNAYAGQVIPYHMPDEPDDGTVARVEFSPQGGKATVTEIGDCQFEVVCTEVRLIEPPANYMTAQIPMSSEASPPAPPSPQRDVAAGLQDAIAGSPKVTGSLLGGQYDIDSRTATDAWKEQFKNRVLAKHRPRRAASRLRVAVLDSGIDLNHADMKTSRIKCKKAWVGETVQDTNGHGTHVAGLILELTENVDLYIGKIGDSVDCLENHIEEIAKAIEHARTDWKVNMICLSFGFDDQVPTIYDAIKECTNRGITVFAAAPNDPANSARRYPASYHNVLAIYSGAASGEWVSVPTAKDANFVVVGQNLRSSWLSTAEDRRRKEYRSGTSFATPVAVSIAALMIFYIETYVPPPAGAWPPHAKPRSVEGMERIFKLMAGGGPGPWFRISPQWYFDNVKDYKIWADIQNSLSA